MYSTSSLLFQSLTAVALGDALGYPIQHDTRPNPFDDPIHEMVEHRTNQIPAGTWSDDTSLSIASLVSLTFGYNLYDLMTRYSQWYHFGDYTPFNNAYDVDNTSKAAIERFDKGTTPVLCGGTLDSDNDNTALKRLMPLAFYILTKNQQYTFNETVADIIHDYTATTNRTPKTFIGSGILTNVIIRLIQNPNKYAMLRAVKEALDYYRSKDQYAAQVPFFEQLEESHFLRQSSTKLRPSSDVIATLNAVFWCLMNSEQYNVAVSKAVNLGSNADTIGSITSMLASLLFAPVTFPENWLSKLQGRNQIKIAVSVALLSDNF